MGYRGKWTQILAFCRKYTLPVHVVIDRDELKYGICCEGCRVQSPQAVREVDTIISTPVAGYDEVKGNGSKLQEGD